MANERVRFLERREVKDHNGQVIESFELGRVYSMAPASAERWVRRSVAERVTAAELKKSADRGKGDE